MSAEDKTESVVSNRSGPTNKNEPDTDGLALGSTAGDYIIEELLGAGGFAQVYRATHRVIGRSAAVKVLSRQMASSTEMVQRFVREARVVNKIHHPNIVDIYDFGHLEDSRPYFVMELLKGKSLGALVESKGRLSAAEAAIYLAPVCSALRAAHEAGVIHRDLKASNIMVCGNENQPTIKLLDFGIAKLLHLEPGEPGLTTEDRRLGTSHAMSPEQIRGGLIDARTDVYALGALLFRLLTGRHPFWSKNPLEVERLHLQTPPPRASQFAPVSPAVDAVVLKCLEKEPAKRYASAMAFIEALRSAAHTGPPSAPGAGRLVSAAALYVEIKLDESHESDDQLLEELATVMDQVEQTLAAANFVPLLQTGSGILGVKALPEDPDQARAVGTELLRIARQIHAVATAPGRDPHLEIQVCSHIGPAEARSTSQGLEVVGGAIAQLDDWVVRSPGGWYASPSAMEGAAGEHP